MGRSREGWTRVRFGDVVRLSTERCTDPLAEGIDRYVGLEHLEPGDLRIRSWGNVADGVTFTNRFRPGQVLFGKRRSYQRKVAVAEFDGICSSDIYVFEPADDRLLPDLLPFICQADGFFEHALKTSAGSLSPRTNWSSLADYEFDLPSLAEQKSLGTLLSACERVRCESSSLRDTAQASIRSYLDEVFTNIAASRDWPVVMLGTVAEVRTGVARHAAKESSAGVAVPYITVAHVQDARIDLSDRRTMRVPHELIPRYQLLPGDVLMTEGGDLDKLGRGAVWQDMGEPYLHQNHVFAVRPNCDALRSDWLAAAARSSRGRSYFLSCAKRTSNLASINKTQVSGFPVPLPPLADQDALLGPLRELEAAVIATGDTISRAQRMASVIAKHARPRGAS
jgi:type I restriction enzyme S subunit